MNTQNSWDKNRRYLERLFGYPRGAFDPASDFLRDAEKLNKALGEGITWLERVMSPQQLLDKIEAGFEHRVSRLSDIPKQILRVIKPPSLDRMWPMR